MCVCVCVPVSVRERERESGERVVALFFSKLASGYPTNVYATLAIEKG